MPCWIYLCRDPNPVHCNEPADVVVRRIEETSDGEFMHIDLTPYAHDDAVRTGYIRPRDVAAVLAMHPRELEADLDDPPDWYAQ
jgi:hypothetical protein